MTLKGVSMNDESSALHEHISFVRLLKTCT